MIRILLIFAALLALAGCRDDSPTASRETSPGGIGYTLIHLPGNPDATIHAAWPTDWAYRADTNKAAPVVGIDLLLTGGAEGYPAGDAPERFADLNSEADIYALGERPHRRPTDLRDRPPCRNGQAIANAHLRAPTLDPDLVRADPRRDRRSNPWQRRRPSPSMQASTRSGGPCLASSHCGTGFPSTNREFSKA
jgi:zinc protease